MRTTDRLTMAFGALLCSACAALGTPAVSQTAGSATAMLRDTSGAPVGTIALAETGSGVLLSGSLSGIAPGTHGIHVHTVGRCDAPGFTSAGGHFNPEQKKHGFRSSAGAHAGDLTNISVPPGGSLTFDLLLPHATLRGTNSLLDADGSAIVIHAGADDYLTDPAGNSGSRIACGVIVAQ
jgi:Cu-Zn family superoxide dismutase